MYQFKLNFKQFLRFLFLLFQYYFLFSPYYFLFFRYYFLLFQTKKRNTKQKLYFRVNSKHTKNAQVLILTFPNIPFENNLKVNHFCCTRQQQIFKHAQFQFCKTQGLTDFNSNKNKQRLLETNQHQLSHPLCIAISYIVLSIIIVNSKPSIFQ